MITGRLSQQWKQPFNNPLTILLYSSSYQALVATCTDIHCKPIQGMFLLAISQQKLKLNLLTPALQQALLH